MATRLYLHDATTSVGGTLPSGSQSGASPDVTWTGATTLRTMNTTIGGGQTGPSANTLNRTTGQLHLIRMFVSPPLSGAQTVNFATTSIMNYANAESNLNVNWTQNLYHIYVWRPSTGARVGFGGFTYNIDNWNGSAEPASTNTETSQHAPTQGSSQGSVSASDGDVIVLEILASFNQSMAQQYTITFYYDGTTETNSSGSTVSNHASYLQLTSNNTFQSAAAADPYCQHICKAGFFGF